jgi:putative CocE/NonD family hydrolase
MTQDVFARVRAATLAAVLAMAVAAPIAALAVSRTPQGEVPATHWHARPATYGVTVEQDIPVRMSDGVTLSVDVYRPATKAGKPAPGRFPVILTQTPYNKGGAAQLAFESDYLVSRGYVQVIADVRGTGSSRGEWASFATREQRDGYELVKWCASRARSWSDGRVGLHGTSYGAINQILTAAQRPPGLKAAFPIVPMADAYRDVAWASGDIDTSFIPFWLGLVTAAGLAPTSAKSDPAEGAQALADHVRGSADFQAQVLANGTTGGSDAYDGPFYRERSPIDVVRKVDVPTFVVGGEFDLFQRGEPMLYQALRATGTPTRLLLGPWYHTTAGQGLPAQGVPSLDALELRWFDHYVRGVPDPTLNHDVAQVTYYDLGTNRWRTAANWPDPTVRFTTLRLGGQAAPGSPGSLGVHRAAGADTLPWVPVTGACSRGTAQWTAGLATGTPCEFDNTVNDTYGLSYDLAAKHPLRLMGPITAHLYVSSNGRDGLVAARLEDVAPDGTVTQLTAGWQTLGLRALDDARSMWAGGMLARPFHPDTKRSLLPIPDGRPVVADVEIFPTAATILPGHILRLTLQPADEPHLTPTLPGAVATAGAVLTFWHDAAHRSSLIVPISR